MSVSTSERLTTRAFVEASAIADALRGQVPSYRRLLALADRCEALARELDRLATEVGK